MLHAITTQTVDVTLALLLLVGSVIGAQYGVRHGARLRGEQIRGLLAALVLTVAIALAVELVLTPDDRSEEHTSELQSLMRTSYAVLSLKNKNYLIASATLTRFHPTTDEHTHKLT